MKKGFTLIELLSVIVILATVSLIVFPSITAIIKSSKENLYNTQVLNIEASAKKWASENTSVLDSFHLNATYIDLIVLRKTGFLTADKVKNPLTSEYMDGCIEIKYDEANSQYTYTYSDLVCSELTSTSSYHGYIVDYEFNKTAVNVLEPAAKYIIANTTGLVETEDEFIFKGNNVNNYIKISNETYRIISINKNDYTLKLIRNNYITSSWCDSTEYLCNVTVFNDLLKSKVANSILETADLSSDKIIKDNTYGVGIIDNLTNESIDVIRSIENSSLKTSNIGLISISDFKDSFLNGNSYLLDLFSDKNVWTMSNNISSDKWIITSGVISTHTPSVADITYAAYPVIKVKASVYITSGTGTSSNAYVIN